MAAAVADRLEILSGFDGTAECITCTKGIYNPSAKNENSLIYRLDGQPEISLTLSQGDPIEVLKGADAWLHRLYRIELRSLKADGLWLDSCGSWLEQKGFQRESESIPSWTLNTSSRQIIQRLAIIVNLRQ